MAQLHTQLTNSTHQNIDSIIIDANLISRRDFMRLTSEINAAIEATDMQKSDRLSGELIEKLVIQWPFGEIISVDAYLDLGLLDSKRVDDALAKVMSDITQKKSESS